MKKSILIALIFVGHTFSGISLGTLVDNVAFASADKAKVLLSQEDEFTESWSQFDIDSRMKKQNSTKEDLLDFITQQAKHWNKEEKAKVTSILKSIDKQIEKRGFKLDLPDELFLLKTTMAEEGGAQGYTRANYIVLRSDLILRTKAELKHTIVHELFHILSRNNPVFRKEMYRAIGFESMKGLEYPEAIAPHRITNPDAPQTDSYIRIEVDGRPVDCMMILYSTKDYSGGTFFDYINVGLLALKGSSLKSIQLVDDQPVIYTIDQVKGFYDQVGTNTEYIMHPEEILAENFTFAVFGRTALPDQHIVEKIEVALLK